MKKIQWHPNEVELLLIHCNVAKPVIHLWNGAWKIPKVVNLSLDKLGGRMEAAWLVAEASDTLSLMLGNSHNHTVAGLSHDGSLSSWPKKGEIGGEGPEDLFDEGNSLDLSPIKISHDTFTTEMGHVPLACGPYDPWNVTDDVDDTFHHRRYVKALT